MSKMRLNRPKHILLHVTRRSFGVRGQRSFCAICSSLGLWCFYWPKSWSAWHLQVTLTRNSTYDYLHSTTLRRMSYQLAFPSLLMSGSWSKFAEKLWTLIAIYWYEKYSMTQSCLPIKTLIDYWFINNTHTLNCWSVNQID